MKTLWICGLLSLLSTVAYSRIAVALSGGGEPPSETRASPAIAAPPSLLNAPAGGIARDVSFGGSLNPAQLAATPAPESTNNDNNVATNLSEYVFLHETRNVSIPFQVPARANVCPE